MTSLPNALAHFVASLPAGRHVRDEAALESKVAKMLVLAEATGPHLEPSTFLTYVAERVPEGTAVDDALDTIQLEELRVAWACLRGDPTALSEFDRDYVRPVLKSVRRVGLDDEAAADVMQEIFEQFLVGKNGGAPALGTYRGVGHLRSFLRVAAVREAIRRNKRDKAHDAGGDDEGAVDEIMSSQLFDPEAQQLATHCRQAFRAAFRLAVKGLEPRERNVLRLNVVRGMSIDHLGAIYGVHRATAARWIESARRRLERETRNEMQQELGISERELDRLLGAVWKELDASIERLLDRTNLTQE